MLFNSYIFLFAFLPLLLLAVWLARRVSRELTISVLIIGSLTFYGYFVPGYILLLLGSALFNFSVGLLIQRQGGSRLFLSIGVAANVGLLGLFKYLDFLISTANVFFDNDWVLLHIVLPLAISFFTFQQIAYLVDVHRSEATSPPLLEYLLFVCFFPQLIAGPIVHHKQLIPQFSTPNFARLDMSTMLIGLIWFTVGLAKKTLLADQMAPIADQAFGIAASGGTPSLFEAWFGTLAFAFQIYFDFSGYSDMAIGLGVLFGIILPINFNAPYKATSIIAFWRHWHMTLSQFLRDYLYFALGGNRDGPFRRYRNVLATMLLGGLWHGAAWTFVVWGGLHGLYIMINHGWHRTGIKIPVALGWLITMVAICFAWTFFRATDFASAISMIEGMAGMNGAFLAADHEVLLGPVADILARFSVQFHGLPAVRLVYFPIFFALVIFTVLAPTTHQLMGLDSETMAIRRRPAAAAAVIAGVLLAISIIGIGQESQFIYFQF